MADSKLAQLEALLFVYGEPIQKSELAALLRLKEEEVEQLIVTYSEMLSREERGLMLVSSGKTIQLVTKPEVHEVVASLIKEEMTQELTPAALETLSLVAYFGPISRARIEYIRGVNSAFTLRNLLMRGMVERITEGKGNYLYKMTPDTLRYLGLRDVSELPDHEELSKLLTNIESQRTDETTTA